MEYKILQGQLQRLPHPVRLLLHGAGFQELAVSVRHAEIAARFDLAHRDPWDRIIAAQAIAEGFTVRLV